MHRKLHKLDVLSEDQDGKASTCGESTQQSNPFAFGKNLLTRGQLRELFGPQDIKKLKLARKRNSHAVTHGGIIKLNKSQPASKKKSPPKNSLKVDSSGLVLEAWPMKSRRKTSVFTLNNSRTRNTSNQATDGANNIGASIQTLQNDNCETMY